MGSKRGNPSSQPSHRKALSQSVANPVGNAENTDSGNTARMRVPAGKKRSISQSVNHPSVRKPG